MLRWNRQNEINKQTNKNVSGMEKTNAESKPTKLDLAVGEVLW